MRRIAHQANLLRSDAEPGRSDRSGGTGVRPVARVADGSSRVSRHRNHGTRGHPLDLRCRWVDCLLKRRRALEDPAGWKRTANNIHACHWEVCTSCTTSGCIANGALLIDPFHGATTYGSVPDGALTSSWAWIPGRVCTLNFGLRCVPVGVPKDVESQPQVSSPEPDGGLWSPHLRSEMWGTLSIVPCWSWRVWLGGLVEPTSQKRDVGHPFDCSVLELEGVAWVFCGTHISEARCGAPFRLFIEV
jgi:hypothetical protein